MQWGDVTAMGLSGTLARSGEVDSLRAIAMLAVIALHCHILPFGWAGVWLFYVISGYVVTASVLARDEASTGMAGYAGFMRRRAVRILPVYFLYLGVGLAVAFIAGIPQDAISLASLVLFFDNITMPLGLGRIAGWPTGHLWTLSVEMQFYVVYGLALCLLPRRVVVAILVALVLLCPIGRFVAGNFLLNDLGWAPLDAAFAVYVAPVLHFDIFAMGALLAFAQASGAMERLARPLAIAGIGLLALYIAAYVMVNHVARGAQGLGMFRNVVSGILVGEHREAFLYSAVGLAMTGVIAVAATGRGPLGPMLRWPALSWIGLISYGGYVYHPLGLRGANMLLSAAGVGVRQGGVAAGLAQFAIGGAIALLLAWLSWRWFEQPIQRLMSRKRHAAMSPSVLTESLEAR